VESFVESPHALDTFIKPSLESPELYTGTEPEWYTIGARFGNVGDLPYYSEGRFDDLRFYDHALDIDEVRALVPEPSTLVLLCMGAVGLLACGWRRKR